MDLKHNTYVYVAGLPADITMEEVGGWGIGGGMEWGPGGTGNFPVFLFWQSGVREAKWNRDFRNTYVSAEAYFDSDA